MLWGNAFGVEVTGSMELAIRDNSIGVVRDSRYRVSSGPNASRSWTPSYKMTPNLVGLGVAAMVLVASSITAERILVNRIMIDDIFQGIECDVDEEKKLTGAARASYVFPPGGESIVNCRRGWPCSVIRCRQPDLDSTPIQGGDIFY